MTNSELIEHTDSITNGAQRLEESHPFQRLVPVTTAYATQPIWKSFNWSDCAAGIDAGQWYVVAFRSVRRKSADLAILTEYDDRAYDEALASSGLLYYFKGCLSPRRACLSFCVWASQQQAQVASRLPLHTAAEHIAYKMYQSYTLERYIVTKRSGTHDLDFHRLT